MDEESRDTRHGRQILRFALGVVVGAGALWLVVSAAGGLGDAIAALGRTNPAWLAPAIAFEAVAYVLGGVRLRRLAGSGADLSPIAAAELELVVNGLGLLTPASPAEGIAFEYRELGRRGLPRRRIALTIAFEQWFSTRVFYLVQALNLLLIVATRDFPADAAWPLAAAAVILSLLALTALAAARPRAAERVAVVLGALRFWRPRGSPAERRVAGARLHAEAMAVVGPPRARVRLMLLSVASLLADVACLWMLMFAVGIHDGFDIALARGRRCGRSERRSAPPGRHRRGRARSSRTAHLVRRSGRRRALGDFALSGDRDVPPRRRRWRLALHAADAQTAPAPSAVRHVRQRRRRPVTPLTPAEDDARGRVTVNANTSYNWSNSSGIEIVGAQVVASCGPVVAA